MGPSAKPGISWSSDNRVIMETAGASNTFLHSPVTISQILIVSSSEPIDHSVSWLHRSDQYVPPTPPYTPLYWYPQILIAESAEPEASCPFGKPAMMCTLSVCPCRQSIYFRVGIIDSKVRHIRRQQPKLILHHYHQHQSNQIRREHTWLQTHLFLS